MWTAVNNDVCGHEWADSPIIFTSDCVTPENYWQITSWVRKTREIMLGQGKFVYKTTDFLTLNVSLQSCLCMPQWLWWPNAYSSKLSSTKAPNSIVTLVYMSSSISTGLLKTNGDITQLVLTHWGQVTHICVSKLTIIGSDNGLSPRWCQAIIWTNAGIWLTRPLETNFSERLIKIHTFSFTKINLKISSGKWRPFCLVLNELITTRKLY